MTGGAGDFLGGLFIFSATAAKRSPGDVFRRETVLSNDRVSAIQISLNFYSHSFKATELKF